jgi:hypothetical protein
MFSKQIVDSDAFLEMPLSTQALYFHLSMRADDDGFLNNAAKIRKIIGASEDDLKLLILKKFVIDFDDGIIVIKHWRINNYLRTDRYRETVYLEEKAMLEVNANGSYSVKKDVGIPGGNQVVYQVDTQYRIDKDSIDKNSIGESNNAHAHEEVDFDDIWNKTFAAYPKKSNHASAKVEWMNRLAPVVEPNRKAVATLIWQSMKLYLKDYSENNPDDTNYRFVPTFNKWLTEDLDYWLAEVERRNNDRN